MPKICLIDQPRTVLPTLHRKLKICSGSEASIRDASDWLGPLIFQGICSSLPLPGEHPSPACFRLPGLHRYIPTWVSILFTTASPVPRTVPGAGEELAEGMNVACFLLPIPPLLFSKIKIWSSHFQLQPQAKSPNHGHIWSPTTRHQHLSTKFPQENLGIIRG